MLKGVFKPALASPLFLVLLWGCAEEVKDEIEVLPVFQHTIDASSREAWAYFSFSSGGPVTISDPTTSTEWDIGFQRFKIRVNCGTSGPGKGGVVNMGAADFDSVTTAPTEGYVVDEMLKWEHPGMPPIEYSGNPAMKDWYEMKGGMPPLLVSKKEVFVIRTADGKYVKMQILDYYDKEGRSGFITFKYAYQPDGTTNLKTK